MNSKRTSSKINQAQKKQIPHDLTVVEFLKADLLEVENRMVITRG